MMKFLDINGLRRLWERIYARLRTLDANLDEMMRDIQAYREYIEADVNKNSARIDDVLSRVSSLEADRFKGILVVRDFVTPETDYNVDPTNPYKDEMTINNTFGLKVGDIVMLTWDGGSTQQLGRVTSVDKLRAYASREAMMAYQVNEGDGIFTINPGLIIYAKDMELYWAYQPTRGMYMPLFWFNGGEMMSLREEAATAVQEMSDGADVADASDGSDQSEGLEMPGDGSAESTGC